MIVVANFKGQLKDKDNNILYPDVIQGNYIFYKWPAGTQIATEYGSVSKDFTITTKGRPVFISVSGDMNPLTDKAKTWIDIDIKKGSTILARQIAEEHAASSWNSPFSLQYLDIVSAGTYTYTITFTSGSGTCQLAEDGAYQAPQVIIFEI